LYRADEIRYISCYFDSACLCLRYTSTIKLVPKPSVHFVLTAPFEFVKASHGHLTPVEPCQLSDHRMLISRTSGATVSKSSTVAQYEGGISPGAARESPKYHVRGLQSMTEIQTSIEPLGERLRGRKVGGKDSTDTRDSCTSVQLDLSYLNTTTTPLSTSRFRF
jgi:hypothetical protein